MNLSYWKSQDCVIEKFVEQIQNVVQTTSFCINSRSMKMQKIVFFAIYCNRSGELFWSSMHGPFDKISAEPIEHYCGNCRFFSSKTSSWKAFWQGNGWRCVNQIAFATRSMALPLRILLRAAKLYASMAFVRKLSMVHRNGG